MKSPVGSAHRRPRSRWLVAQSRSAWHPRPSRCDDYRVPQLDVIGVIVSDIDKAIDFYQRLGLRFPENADPEGHGHVETTLSGGLRFTLDTEESIRSFDPGWSPPSGGHRMAVAFRCDSPDDVDRVYKELLRAGADDHKEPWDAFWGQRYAQVKDPDGNVVDLFAPVEG
jgi:catechol 2,3-dioxygenase-like lactoylglutathione lyase family enzyme